jgi:hypothetical protein
MTIFDCKYIKKVQESAGQNKQDLLGQVSGTAVLGNITKIQGKDPGSGFKVRIQGKDSGSVARARIQGYDSGLGFKVGIRVRIWGQDPGSGFRVKN